jgi:hypothetical protein
MQRYNIISGILLILSIIDIALAAPVLVQEKRQASVDVVHIPRDVITVLGKRGPGGEVLDQLANLAKENLETGKKPVESSDAHAPSSLAPLGPDPGSTNVVPAPAPNPAPSTANPTPLMESPTTSSEPESESEPGEDVDTDSEEDEWFLQLNKFIKSGAHLPHWQNKRPLTGPDPNLEDRPPPRPIPKVPKFEEWGQARPAIPKRPIPKVPKFEEWGQAKVGHVQQPNPNKRPLTGPDLDSDRTNLDDPPPLSLRPAKVPKLVDESGQANEHQVHVQQPDQGPSTSSGFDGNYHPEAVPSSVPVEYLPSTSAGLPAFHAPPPSPESADPELPSDHQSLSTDSEPVDLLAAATYAAKGKAKESRRISGTTRDVGYAARM